MKRLFKNILCLSAVLITLNACQSVKEGLSGTKKNNTDEFLVKKNKPLVQPPEFNKLPEPKTLISNDEEEIDLKTVLKKKKITSKSILTSSNSNKSLEKNILDKIKNN